MSATPHHFLVIGGPDTRAAELCEMFRNAKIEATNAPRFGQAIAFARTKRPTAIVLLGDVNEKAAQEWIAALTLQPGTASLPLVVITPPPTPKAALNAFQGGAAALINRELTPRNIAHAVIESVGMGPHDPRSHMAAQHTGANMMRRVVGYFAHTRATATVRIEGATAPAGIRFVDGQIADAAYGSRTGQAAVGELMISGDTARWRFELHAPQKTGAANEAMTKPVAPPPMFAEDEEEIVLFDEGAEEELDAIFGVDGDDEETEEVDDLDFIDISLDDFKPPAAASKPPQTAKAPERVAQLPPLKVLVVDDDPALIGMYEKVLSGRNHTVFTANNGKEGYETATRERPDVIVSDIAMPEIDGWGLLGLVRRDFAVRETVFSLLSCHTDYLASLKNFDAGADDYLEKGLRPTEVVSKVEALVAPRRNLLACIRPGFAFSDDLHTLGAGNTVAALSRARVTGRLTVTPKDVVIEVNFHEGVIRSASWKLGEMAQEADMAALARLHRYDSAPLVFEPGPVAAEPTLNQEYKDIALALYETLNQARSELEEDLLSQDRPLVATAADVAKFFALTCPDPMRPVLAALYGGRSPRAVMGTSDASPLVIEALVKDVLRKGVMRFS